MKIWEQAVKFFRRRNENESARAGIQLAKEHRDKLVIFADPKT